MRGGLEGSGPVFEVTDTDLAGRIGRLRIGQRMVETPDLMPVVNPNSISRGEGIPPSELYDTFRFRMLITNSYIIKRNPAIMEEALKVGLHRLLSFDGAIMTDSGTFQSYVYGGGVDKEVDVDPIEIVELQSRLGSDVGTILDIFTPPGVDRVRAGSALELTMERAKASMDRAKDMVLAVPIQGGEHLDLRERSGRQVLELGSGYAPIGGVVPIMESYDYPLLVDVIASSKKGLGPSVPTHLFGAGHPMVLPLASALGCDLFDSASYAKYAKDGRYLTPYRTLQLSEMTSLPCSCRECSGRSPEDLRAMDRPMVEGVLSRHNLWVIRQVLDEVRASIREGTLWEMVERFALSNPMMYSGVKRLFEHRGFLEENAPRSLKRFMCCTSLSLCRPEFSRTEAALATYPRERYPDRVLALTDWTASRNRPVEELMGRSFPQDIWPAVISPLGTLPYDVLSMYPMTQALFPPPGFLDEGLGSLAERAAAHLGGPHVEVVPWSGKGNIGLRSMSRDTDEMDSLSVSSMLRLQFGGHDGRYADELMFGPYTTAQALKARLSFVRSRTNNRVRNVLLAGSGEGPTHVLSIRAEDGLVNLKISGARKLLEGSSPPRWRVVVDSETGAYNAQGRNVFNRFVKDADPAIRPGDEVMVVDSSDKLLAVGKANAQYRMMMDSLSGIAVKVREGVDSGKGGDVT
ncbi:MAG: tRNA guanosine(15) transglycosylase TgtA [Candidatus Thermoplasmatota archaeon]|jgi:7-cyano-7-deazaguanine tRNA-ribosyltransferase|nr:tRNA guanosine(15) transglycosylase TgtA [Candidatus Thermoplasmatota archaeon]